MSSLIRNRVSQIGQYSKWAPVPGATNDKRLRFQRIFHVRRKGGGTTVRHQSRLIFDFIGYLALVGVLLSFAFNAIAILVRLLYPTSPYHEGVITSTILMLLAWEFYG